MLDSFLSRYFVIRTANIFVHWILLEILAKKKRHSSSAQGCREKKEENDPNRRPTAKQSQEVSFAYYGITRTQGFTMRTLAQIGRAHV